jgi:hypothetical protein
MVATPELLLVSWAASYRQSPERVYLGSISLAKLSDYKSCSGPAADETFLRQRNWGDV